MTHPATTEPDLTEAMEVLVERIARAMIAVSRPSANPDDLTPAPRGTAGLIPKWRQFEHLAQAAARVIATALEARDARIRELKVALDTLTQWEGHHVYCGHGSDDSKPCVCGFNRAYDEARAILTKQEPKA